MTNDKIPAALIRRLGTEADSRLAEQFKVSTVNVSKLRRERGISQPRVAHWTEENLALLGTMPDQALAELIGISDTAVFNKRKRLKIQRFGLSRDKAKHRWTQKQLSWLGVLTDAEIARRTGLNTTTVGTKRRKLRIGATRRGRKSHQWSKAELKLLGTLPDAEVARRVGVHRRRVALKRAELGIPNATVGKS